MSKKRKTKKRKKKGAVAPPPALTTKSYQEKLEWKEYDCPACHGYMTTRFDVAGRVCGMRDGKCQGILVQRQAGKENLPPPIPDHAEVQIGRPRAS